MAARRNPPKLRMIEKLHKSIRKASGRDGLMRRNSFGAILLSALITLPVVNPSPGATQRGVEAARKPDSSPYVWIDSLSEPAKVSFLIRVEDGKKIATVAQSS